MAASEELSIVIRARDEASRELQKVKGEMEGVEGVSDRVKNIFGAIAVAAEAMVVAAVKFAGDFEASMDRVAAATGATGEELKAITEDIKELSRGTIFNYDAVASALTKLVQGGHDVEDALRGIVKAAQDLAGITGENLDTVAQNLGRVIKVFDDSGRKPQEYADLFAEAIMSIGVSMGELGNSVIKLSPIVTQGGDDLETLLAALELLDQRGVSVSEAVNGLSRAFAQFELIKVGEETARMTEALERMGPAVQAAAQQVKEGKMTFIELLDVIADYEPAFGDLVAVFGQFGAKAIDKLLPALKDSTESFGLFKKAAEESVRPLDELVEKFRNVSGAAESIRETVQDNLPGAFSKLGTSIKNLLVDLAGGTEALTGFVTGISGALEEAARRLSEHGGLFSLIKEAFVRIGEEIFKGMQSLADNFVHFWTVSFPESIIKAMQTVWNVIADGMATFFEKIPVIGQSMAEFMRGKKFEIDLQTDIVANIKLGDVTAEADKVDVTGRDIKTIAQSIQFSGDTSITLSAPSVVDFTGTNLSLAGLGFGTVASSASRSSIALDTLTGAANAAQTGFTQYAQSYADTQRYVDAHQRDAARIAAEMAEKERKARERQAAFADSMEEAMKPLVGMFQKLAGPLSPLIEALHAGTFGLRTFTQILVNLAMQSDGFRRLIAAINRLLQPVADALGWIFGALADAIEKSLGKGKTSGEGETATEGMAAGGYTFGPTTSVAGVVHGGEWVAPAWMVRQHPATIAALEALRSGDTRGGIVGRRMGFQSGGLVDTAVGGGYKTLTSAIGSAADQVSGVIERTSGDIEHAVVSLGIPTGYKLARAAWGVAAAGQPWFARKPSDPSMPGIPGDGGEYEPTPTPEPPSAPEPAWLTWVRSFLDPVIDWFKGAIEWLVGTFQWFDNFLKNLGLSEPIRLLIHLFTAIVATRSLWILFNKAVESAVGGVVGFVSGIAKFAGDALWGAIRAAGTAIWGAIQTAGTVIWGGISAAGLGIWVGIAGAAIAGLVAFGPQIVGFIQGVFGGIRDFLISQFGGVGQAIVSVFEIALMPLKWIMNGFIWMANGVIAAINWALGWAGVKIPSIPYLQEGGRILEEGLAYLHRGETVVPARAAPYGGQSISIQQMTVVANDPEEFMERMEAAIRRKNLRGTGQRYGSYATVGT